MKKILITLAALAACVSCEKKAETPEEQTVTAVDPKDQIIAQLEKPYDVKKPEPLTRPIIEGKFTPPDGKLLMFIGQDSDTLTDYVNGVPEDHIEGVTLYSRIISKNIGNDHADSLPALFGNSEWGAGNVHFDKSLNESPEASVAVGLFVSDTNDGENRCKDTHTNAIANGEYDEVLVKMIEYFKSLAPRKVFLRHGYEFDGPWNCYTPESYKASFRYMYKKLKEMKADNVVTVWQSAVWPADTGNPIYDHRRGEDLLNEWYPGDEYVEWMALSVFYRDLSQWNYVPEHTPAGIQEAFLEFARKHNKPVMIAEAAPQGFRIGELTHSFTQLNNPTSITADQLWDGWFAPFFGFIYNNRDVIRAVAYINAQWETQPMWRCDQGEVPNRETCQSGNWGDSRIQANELIKKRWLQHVNNSEYWIQTSLY